MARARNQKIRLSSAVPQLNPHGVDLGAGILRGAIVISKGEAKGHGLWIGDEALDKIAQLKELAVRADPPSDDIHGGAMSIVGKAYNFRREGDDVRADIELFDLPERDRLLKLAVKAPNLFGLSLDLTYKVKKTLSNKLKEIVPTDVRSVDFVDQPAAARALFQQVDTTTENDMDINFTRTLCAKFGIAFPDLDSDANDEIVAEAQRAVLKKLSEDEEKKDDKKAEMAEGDEEKKDDKKAEMAEGDEKKKDEKDEKMSEDEEKKDEKKDDKMSVSIDIEALTLAVTNAVVAKLQAKGLSAVGSKNPAKPDVQDDSAVKSASLAKDFRVQDLAVKLKAKPEELAAKFAKLTESQMKVCLSMGLDPEEYARQVARFGDTTKQISL